MATLIYITNVSLDGYIEDEHGAFDWAPPDDDVFAATTALVRSAGTFLYGRRLYEKMSVWETNPALAEQSDLTADFANAWQAADKVVYSTTLTAVSTATTRLEHHFDHDAVAESVLVDELEVGADACGEGRLATAEDHGPDEELALVDQAGFEGLGGEVRPADGEVAGGFSL